MEASLAVGSIRPGVAGDIDRVCAIDEVAQADGDRREFIKDSLEGGQCLVATDETGSITGYAVLEYSFFGHGFLSMVYTAADHRRQRYATTLIDHVEVICRTEKIFSSTNLSNVPMQSLFAKRGYQMSGVVYGLDADDPELIYSKGLRNAK